MKGFCFVITLSAIIVFTGCAAGPRMAPKTVICIPDVRLEVFGLTRDSFSSEPGIIPVVVENPDVRTLKVLVFSGNDRVEIIPNAAGGAWSFNKVPVAWFRLSPRHDASWYSYGVIYLPANTMWTFMVIREGLWGDSIELDCQAAVYVGNTPFSRDYYRRTPYSGGVYKTGGFVSLPAAYNYPRSLQVSLEIDPVRDTARAIRWLREEGR